MGHNPPMLSSYENAAEAGGTLELFGDNTLPLEQNRAYDQVLPMIVPPPLFTDTLNQATQAGTQSEMWPEVSDNVLIHPSTTVWDGEGTSVGVNGESLAHPRLSTGYLGQSGIWPEASFHTPVNPHTTV